MYSDARSSKPSRSEPPFKGFWNWRAKDFRAFLSTFIFKSRWQGPTEIAASLPQGSHDTATHLQKCCERALDAHTVEDAIFWHSEVINELSIEIYSMATMPWPDVRKQRAIADLTDLQNRHGAILHRLTGIVARNEQLIWQPTSVCRK
ncbi:hypothetical protein [Hyphomicrobium denitrificans]|uniref:hypothetical protein n=1 Tax=Hyphomicrobium denitrificans TaxID=53399 RepID=UPI00022E2446|nr:hypothetical protein [Hyphomicrobium denitrificans]